MIRRLVLLFTVLCMCWQSLAYAGSGALVAHDEDKAHAMLHFEGEGHHHHEDEPADIHEDGAADIHEDESPASDQHVMLDAGVFSPALTHFLDLPVPVLQPEEPVSRILAQGAPPFLRGLDRPPKTRS